jgi:large repetitive protein
MMMLSRDKGGFALLCALAIASSCAADKDPEQRTAAVGTGARIRYAYDALGRLIQAAAGDGTGVQYSYDPVGNITSIRRLAATTLGVLDFGPHAGTIGATVTVYGSGFDPVAAANAITFNATAGTVTGATPTTLTVNVPAGATTGKIAVSNRLGSASSAADFVVLGSSPAPTITGFSPTVATLAAVITVTGTHFEPNADNDSATVGRVPAVVVRDATSPTPTQLKLTVPTATASGRIEVTTPFGRATSAGDLFVVPSSVNPASVEATGRLSVGGPALTVTTSVAGKKAVLLFDAQAGQRLHLVTAGGAFAAGFAAEVYSPTGAKLETLSLTNHGAADFTAPAPLDGTYTMILHPGSSDKGTVQLRVVADVTGTLTVDGNTALALAAGQNARLRFTAPAATGHGLAITGLGFTPTTGSPSLTVTLRKADGTSLTTCAFVAAGSCDLEPASFAAAGPYLIDFDPSGVVAAGFTATMSTDAVGEVSVDAAAPAVVAIARAGQNARYRFTGAAGQLVSVVLSGNTLDDGDAATPSSTQVSVFKPSSSLSAIANSTVNAIAGSLILDLTLPEAGSYTVAIKPTRLDQGSIHLALTSVATGSLTVNGSTAVSLGGGQNGRFSFAAQAATGHGLAITGLGFVPTTGSPSLTVTLRKPDGTSLTSCAFAVSGSCDLGPASFATAGTYLLDFDPSGLATAGFTAVLSSDAIGAVTVDAATPSPVTIAREGQNARHSFTGAAGQLVSVVVTGNALDDGNASTVNNTQVQVFQPSSLVAAPIGNGNFNTVAAGLVLDLTLPETGSHAIAIHPGGLDKGSVNLQVKSTATGSLALNGTTAVSLGAGQNARYSFAAQAATGHGLAITGLGLVPATGSPSLTVTLRKADGSALTTCTFTASGSCDFAPASFATAGSYLVDFDPSGLTAASFTAVLSSDATGAVTVDAATPTPVTLARAGHNARYRFTGTAGHAISIVLSGNALDDGSPGTVNTTVVLIGRPSNGATVASGTFNTVAAGLTINTTLPETGTYSILINPSGLDSGTINLGVKHQ